MMNRRPYSASPRSFVFRSFLSTVILTLLLLSLSGCLFHSRGKVRELGMNTFPVDQDQSPYDIFQEYRLMPGDVLDVLYQVKTWNVSDEVQKSGFKLAVDHTVAVKFPNLPNLNEEQFIRPDGTISLPYLGSVKVLGKTVDELTNELRAKYKEILKDPEVYVVVPEFRMAIKELKNDLHTAPRGLSRLVTVRPDGWCTFFLLGDIFVKGKTIPEIRKVLNEGYEKEISGLHCDLFLEQHAGSRIYVLGEVNGPGSFQILKPTPIEQALAMAGSPTKAARLSEVVVIRRHESKVYATRVDVTKTLKIKKGSELFYLAPDDVVYVPKRPITKWSEISSDVTNTVAFRGWSIGAGLDLTGPVLGRKYLGPPQETNNNNNQNQTP